MLVELGSFVVFSFGAMVEEDTLLLPGPPVLLSLSDLFWFNDPKKMNGGNGNNGLQYKAAISGAGCHLKIKTKHASFLLMSNPTIFSAGSHFGARLGKGGCR